MEPIDQVTLNFNPTTLTLLNVIIGFIMFGVALTMRADDFRRIGRDPRGPLIGMVSQFLLLPAVSFVLVWALTEWTGLAASIALGMILVAASPGGNFSNFLTSFAKANTAMSVSMTAASTLLAMVMTPFNLQFWGSRMEGTDAILRDVSLDPVDLMVTIVLILVIPAIAGMTLAHYRPELAKKLEKPMQRFALVAFFSFIVLALAGNWNAFLAFVGLVMVAVFLQNAIALATGYWAARGLRLPKYDARAISIETGIQNSALSLVIVFTFFDGLGGMAVVAAWWGIWHLVSGLSVATYWRRHPVAVPDTSGETPDSGERAAVGL